MTHLGRLLERARRARGLTYPALAARLGYRNLPKGARRLAALEQTGEDAAGLLPALADALQIDMSVLQQAVERDRDEAIAALQVELREPFAPQLVVRWFAGFYQPLAVPESLATDSAREAWACARARALGRRACLRLSRRHSVWIEADGSVSRRTETTVDNPRNAPRPPFTFG